MKIIINHQPVDVKEGITVMEACRTVGIDIPSLCFLKDVSENASCGVCVVEVKGARSLLRSCITKVTDGMEILTASPRVREARKVNVELILANHPQDCLQCDRNLNCELQSLAFQLGIKESRFVRTRKKYFPKDEPSLSLVRDPEKCILCGRCVAGCNEMQTVNAIDCSGRGLNTRISTFFDKGLGATYCTNCGQCSLVCPTGAITEKSYVQQVWQEIHNPDKVVLIQNCTSCQGRDR
jgi:NADH dehydrogenase/NADH:ubiquinone oxidoreductase subunit G